MPPKKNVWFYCSACNCHFHVNFEKQHAAQCSEISKVPSTESVTGNYVVLKPVSNDVELEEVRGMYRVDLHPETMEVFGIYDFDRIEINSACVCIVLPNERVSKGCFELPNEVIKGHLKADKLQKISILRGAPTATRVELFVRNGNGDWPAIGVDCKQDFTNYLKFTSDGLYLRKGFVFSTFYLNWDIRVTVTSISSSSNDESGWLESSELATDFKVRVDGEREVESFVSSPREIAFADLLGYSEEKRRLLELRDRSLKSDRPLSLLIHGRKGCGKTSFGLALGSALESSGVDFHVLSVHDVVGYANDQNLGVLKAVKEAKKKKKRRRKTTMMKEEGEGCRHAFFFDDLQGSCGTEAERTTADVEMSRQVLLALKHLLADHDTCLVFGSCQSPDGLRPEATSAFEERLLLEAPSPAGRADFVLARCLSDPDARGSLTREEIASVVDDCHGFVAQNLVFLCNKAELNSGVRALKLRGEAKVTVEDLRAAYEYTKEIVPDFHHYAMVTSPVHWDDIVGYDDLKVKIKLAFEWPIKRPEQFKNLGLTPQRGVLLYGPPGCCKTMVARAVATEFKLNFIAVRGSDLLSMYVGESEKNVSRLFAKARRVAPSLLFFDEIDSIATKRSGSNEGGTSAILSALLTEMDGLESMEGVAILAATNKPSAIDKALLRFKRLGQSVYVRLPCSETRRSLLKRELEKMDASPDLRLDSLVDMTERFSGDELVKVCQEAGYKCLAEDMNGRLETRHFMAVLRHRQPVTSREALIEFDKFELTNE